MYKQIFAVQDGWHFVSEGTVKSIVHPIAAWAVTEKGNVIGLIGDVRGGGGQEPQDNNMARLVSVPPIAGTYKHQSTMTAEELSALKPR